MRESYLWTDKFEFVSIRKMLIEKELNEHGWASIEGVIHEKNRELYLQSLLEEQWVEILIRSEEGNIQILFKGLVFQAELEEGDVETVLKLQLVTGTYLMDKKEHYRIIQKDNYGIKDVLDVLGEGYQDYKYEMHEPADVMEGMLVQYKETDWKFMKRMLGEKGYCIIPDCYRSGVQYSVGVFEDVNTVIDEKDFRLMKKGDERRYIVTSREVYHLGEKVTFRNQTFYIYKMTTKYLKAECIHEYHLLTEKDLGIKKLNNKEIAGCSFPAVVRTVQRDKVQVQFLNNEIADGSMLGEIQKWLCFSTVYSTPAGAGWYCMPEIGDRVRIHFPSDKEEDAYAVSAVHLDNGKDRQNPACKSIKNRYGKEILLTPNSVVMTNNNGMKISLDDETGIMIKSNKDINIIADGDMVLSSSKASVMIAGTESVAVNQGEAGILLDKDILFNGREFRIQ